MTRATKDRWVSRGHAVLFAGYVVTAAHFGVLALALLLWLGVGLVVLWRLGDFGFMRPRDWRSPLMLLGTATLAMMWPLGLYVEWSRADETGKS